MSRKRYAVLGIDFGVVDATAFSTLVWYEYSDIVYVAECFSHTNLIPSDAAEITKELSLKYQYERIVGDVGGLGKGFAEEMRRRHHIPILPAEKQNKLGYISLLNGALEQGKLKVYRPLCRQLIDEWKTLIWHESKTKEHQSFNNHCSDATLYGWRSANAFMAEREPSPLPKWGTEEAYAQKARELEERAERDWERQQRELESW